VGREKIHHGPGGVMLKFLLGAAVGYVLGANAGHGRYEQLLRTCRRLSDHPVVQGAAGVARARVDEKVNGRQRTVSSSNGQSQR
jgi:hypothetical protein